MPWGILPDTSKYLTSSSLAEADAARKQLSHCSPTMAMSTKGEEDSYEKQRGVGGGTAYAVARSH